MAYVKAVDYHSEGNKKALWHTVAGIGIVLNYCRYSNPPQILR